MEEEEEVGVDSKQNGREEIDGNLKDEEMLGLRPVENELDFEDLRADFNNGDEKSIV